MQFLAGTQGEYSKDGVGRPGWPPSCLPQDLDVLLPPPTPTPWANGDTSSCHVHYTRYSKVKWARDPLQGAMV
jgi:hypothetical protein